MPPPAGGGRGRGCREAGRAHGRRTTSRSGQRHQPGEQHRARDGVAEVARIGPDITSRRRRLRYVLWSLVLWGAADRRDAEEAVNGLLTTQTPGRRTTAGRHDAWASPSVRPARGGRVAR